MSTPLPIWIQRLLGVDGAAGEGAAWHLEHAWPWPPWATVLIVLLLVVFVGTIYARQSRRVGLAWRTVLATIRLTLIGILLLMIARFVLCIERTGLPCLAVVVDDSASMTIVDRYNDRVAKQLTKRLNKDEISPSVTSRENLAKMLLSEKNNRWLERFARNYKLRFFYLTGAKDRPADTVEQLAEDIRQHRADGQSTRLGTDLSRVIDDLRGMSPAGIVLFTDGINTQGPGIDKAAELAKHRGVPLFIVGLGDERPKTDVQLTDVLVDDVVFVNDTVFFDASLTSTGFDDKKLRVVLHQEGRSEVLAEAEVTAEGDGRLQTVRLAYRPGTVGTFRYVVEVEPIDGELQTDNNRATRVIEVRKEQIRVLLVQAYPNFEYRYLRKMLGRDETIRLDTLLQEADVGHAEQDASALAVFPVRREELFKYDVVILGDVDFKRLGTAAMQDLAALVDRQGRGGSLVFLAGPEYDPLALRGTPLERLLPIVLGSVVLPRADQALTEGFRVEPTELGLANPAMQLGRTAVETKRIWHDLPPLYWMIDAPDLKPGAMTLAANPKQLDHDGRPLPVICLHNVGAGKVLMHMTDETWRWRVGVGETYFARYWVQMIRYLARSKLIDEGRQAVLVTDRREYRQGEPVQFRLRFVDPRQVPSGEDDITLVVERDGRPPRRVVMTRHATGERFEATIDNLDAGRYHAWVTRGQTDGNPPSVDFTVTRPAGEFERTQMEAEPLRAAAQQTRGRFFTMNDVNRLIDELPAGHQVPIETLPPIPLWNRWPVLALFLALLIAEWIIRKMKGMV